MRISFLGWPCTACMRTDQHLQIDSFLAKLAQVSPSGLAGAGARSLPIEDQQGKAAESGQLVTFLVELLQMLG